MLLKNENQIFRVLKSQGNKALVIDCIKRTMPHWVDSDFLSNYDDCGEDEMYERTDYEYLLDGQEKHLSIRAFTDNQKREAYERQKGICPKCKEHFDISQMEADHIDPWSGGGKTTADNCQMLCKSCNRRKSDK